MYNKGHSEKIIGDHIGKHASKRDRVVIATKTTGNMFPGDPNGGGGGRKAIFDAVEHSLRRLQTDYIDLLWAHFRDKNVPMEETVRAYSDLVQQGKVRYFGLSDHQAWWVASAVQYAKYEGLAPITALQIEYSLVERTVEAELMQAAQHFGLGVTPWSPLKGGILTGKYTRDSRPDDGRAKSGWINEIDDRTFNIVDALIEVGHEAGCTPAQAALKWVQEQPGVTSTIIGARTMEQLTANCDALEAKLTDAHMAKLSEVSTMRQAFPYDFVERVQMQIQGGATVNGVPAEVSPLLPQNDDERW
ncbi:MAG: aldo/keto reductase [Planctomycetota bacterium]